jgi:hypothetical protein
MKLEKITKEIYEMLKTSFGGETLSCSKTFGLFAPFEDD